MRRHTILRGKEKRSPTPAMTETHNLAMTDTKYAKLIAQGYDPNLEHQLIELGESLDQARKLARVVGLTQDKAPETDQEWEEFMAVWGD
ncbi:hypothetical protein ACWATR_35455 [Nostoc sp. UIC 10890]